LNELEYHGESDMDEYGGEKNDQVDDNNAILDNEHEKQEAVDRQWNVMDMSFVSEEAAFYNKYARDRGFSIRKDNVKRGKRYFWNHTLEAFFVLQGREASRQVFLTLKTVMRDGGVIFSPSSWEPQVEGMMNIAAKFFPQLRNQGMSVRRGRSQTTEGDAC
jgi:hypothetical protein